MKDIHVVGNCVALPNETKINTHINPNVLTFVGKMNYEPNIVAVSWFATNVFLQLKQKHCDLKFYIVGAMPTKSVQTLSVLDGVIVTGFVDTVEPYFQSSTIVVAPMLTGAGLQNKILQAMSYQCCVATTTIGAEGLNIEDKPIAVFNGAQQWIEGLDFLLMNEKERMLYGKRARNYVKKNLSKEKIRKDFELFIGEL